MPICATQEARETREPQTTDEKDKTFANVLYYSWTEDFFPLEMLILVGPLVIFFEIQDSHNETWMCLELAVLNAVLDFALTCCLFLLALLYTQHLWDKLSKAKVSSMTVQSSRLCISIDYSLLVCVSAMQLFLFTIIGGFFGFYLGSVVGVTMLISSLLTCHMYFSCTIDRERIVQQTKKAKRDIKMDQKLAERQAKMDQKDRKIATLESTVEGLHHRLHVLRQNCQEEVLEAVCEQKAEAIKVHNKLIEDYRNIFDKFDTTCSDQQREIKALEEVLIETRNRHAETIGKLHFDQSQALAKVKADTKSDTRATVFAELQKQFDDKTKMIVEHHTQYTAAKGEAYERALAQKDTELEEARSVFADLEDQYLDALEKKDESYAQALRKKDGECDKVLKENDKEHGKALEEENREHARDLVENEEEYHKALQKRDDDHAQALEKQKGELNAAFAEHLHVELQLQERRFASEKKQAEANAADQAVNNRRTWCNDQLEAADIQHRGALAQRAELHGQNITKLREAFDIQFDMAAQRHRDELEQKENDVNTAFNDKSQEIEDLNRVLTEKALQIDRLEYEKLCHIMNWEVVSEEKEGEDEGLAAARGEGTALIDYRHEGYEADNDDSDFGSVDSLPELVQDDDEEQTADREPAEPASETDDDEWRESDVEIVVDGDGDEGELRRWSIVDSDNEGAWY